MKKRISGLLLSMAVIASGCSDEGATKTESPSKETKESNGSAEQQVEEVNKLSVKEDDEQFGNDSLSGELTDYPDTKVAVKDGYTYFVEPMHSKNGLDPNADTDTLYYQFVVSVIKDDKFIVKEETVDLSKEIWNTGGLDSVRSHQFINLGDKVLLVTQTELSDGTVKEQWHNVTFNVKGEDGTLNYQHKVVFEKEYSVDEQNNQQTSLLPGMKSTYFLEKVTDLETTIPQLKIYDEAGKVVKTIENKNEKYPNVHYMDEAFFDEEKDLIFFSDTYMLSQAQMYDIKKDDMVWKQDGSEKEYDISAESLQGFAKTDDDGLYILTQSADGYELKYLLFGEEQMEEVSTFEYHTELEMKKAIMDVDKKNIYVYTFVNYKGKPTIQRSVIPRIDK
ncbi:hypothetical protein MZM54_03760 [[Brevibacterium] frigoritolerans]|nr:hypothetical protein [Peribacillus frigoritolerans]